MHEMLPELVGQSKELKSGLTNMATNRGLSCEAAESLLSQDHEDIGRQVKESYSIASFCATMPVFTSHLKHKTAFCTPNIGKERKKNPLFVIDTSGFIKYFYSS